MLPAIVPALVQGGLSFLSGKLAGDAQAKQARLQIVENNRAAMANITTQHLINQHNEKLGRKLLREKATTEEWSESKTSPTMVANSVDVDGMMRAAEAAGINPITFIRNGGLAAYARSETSGGESSTHSRTEQTGHNAVAAYQLMSPGGYFISPNNVGPQNSSGQALAQGLSDGFRAYMDQANRQEAQDFQRELLNTQLAAAQQREATRASRSFYVPGFSTAGGTITSKGAGGLSKNPLASPTPEIGGTSLTNPWPAWMGMEVSPYRVDAEVGEKAHGDIAQELWGLYNIGADVTWNLSKYLRNSPTVNGLSAIAAKAAKDLGLSVTYQPKTEPERPLTFTVKPRSP